MKCPNCGARKNIDLNSHSEGFSSVGSPVKECGSCGLVWRIKKNGSGKNELDVIREGKGKQVQKPAVACA